MSGRERLSKHIDWNPQTHTEVIEHNLIQIHIYPVTSTSFSSLNCYSSLALVCLSHRPEVTQESLRLKSLLLVLIIKFKDMNKPLTLSISSRSSNCVAYEANAKTWCQQLLCLHHAWFMSPSYSISFYIGLFFCFTNGYPHLSSISLALILPQGL